MVHLVILVREHITLERSYGVAHQAHFLRRDARDVHSGRLGIAQGRAVLPVEGRHGAAGIPLRRARIEDADHVGPESAQVCIAEFLVIVGKGDIYVPVHSVSPVPGVFGIGPGNGHAVGIDAAHDACRAVKFGVVPGVEPDSVPEDIGIRYGRYAVVHGNVSSGISEYSAGMINNRSLRRGARELEGISVAVHDLDVCVGKGFGDRCVSGYAAHGRRSVACGNVRLRELSIDVNRLVGAVDDEGVLAFYGGIEISGDTARILLGTHICM